ncbi:hypothetical protein JCM10212_003166 [Sporobolomyces blumeae]
MLVHLSTLTVLFSLATSAHAGLNRSPNVKALSARTFKKAVQGSPKLTVAAFTAPWCGYCKQLAPDLDKVADSLKGLVNVVNVDCDEDQNKPLCGEYGVQGFPTLKIFPGGSAPVRNYDGPRNAKDIISHATSSMPTFVKRAATAQDLDELRTKASPRTAASKPVSLLFTSAGKVTPLYKALSSDFFRSIDFYAARDVKVGQDAMDKFGVDKVPTLLVLTGPDQVEKYEGLLKYDKLHDFLSRFAAPAPGSESKGGKAPGAKGKTSHSEL